ncbi:uncharacterized protein BCR38DRAFT_484187 [Pseudomassariella vexata]|uniref:Zn(2)-C6 fungal-type domain-containing protein n=1 Tax=Pseudomassariella vexata TaxID=1141098 RepID=A0A1Y2E5E1_9PEZI|nr:uncharacterized protein BCR38DRAFT_484187 [Pseudomassariella vexata]ORY66574.1 hypothetical protein BCR38DRAFT_484187 [Pseudomassariella vexata]
MPDSEGRQKRTRSGCLECRRKRRKCDETKPACLRCNKARTACTWASGISFRPPATLEGSQCSGSPGSVKGKDRLEEPPRCFEILDVTESVIREYEGRAADSGANGDNDDSTQSLTKSGSQTSHPQSLMRNSTGAALPASDIQSVASPSGQSSPTRSEVTWMSYEDASRHSYSQAEQGLLPSDGKSMLYYGTSNSQQQNDAAANLLYLRQTEPRSMESQAGGVEPGRLSIPINMILTQDEEASMSSGIFSPGSIYLQLQSTLRHHLFQESRSCGPSRVCTPDAEHSRFHTPGASRSSDQDQAVDGDDTGLTNEQEYLLWKNWVEELSPWLDKFDREKHFRNTLPILSRSNLHLKYSILAVSARQLERKKDPNGSPTGSLALYQQAIHYLLPCLGSRSISVIASCVVLCVLEMLSCSPKAWQRHLDGCATLLQTVAINGFSGGIEQSLFWCFARMDICGGLISSSKTLIPVSAWVPAPDLESAIRIFQVSSCTYESHACQAVFLTAHVVTLLSSVPSLPANTSVFAQSESTNDSFSRDWQQLWHLLDEWFMKRPGEMYPVLTHRLNSNHPFPTILYSSPSAISGNQLYHTATLLMLQHKPAHILLPTKPRSILWHARQIVGISASNHHHGSWTNALQPLWIAGRLFSSPAEHGFILDLLDMIERESGWATKWRADDLREWWGDHGD